MTDVVYVNTIDSGRWKIHVERESEHIGVLRVTAMYHLFGLTPGTEILATKVTLRDRVTPGDGLLYHGVWNEMALEAADEAFDRLYDAY